MFVCGAFFSAKLTKSDKLSGKDGLLSGLSPRPKTNSGVVVFSTACVVLDAVYSLGMRLSPCRHGAIVASFPGRSRLQF